MKVAWQVTGIRKDPWAVANRIPVGGDRPDKGQEYYQCPEFYGQPAEKRTNHLLLPKELEQLARLKPKK